MSTMKSTQYGFSVLVVPLAVAVILLIGALVFGGWAYSGMQDYKNNVDRKISAAVEVAKQQESDAKDAEFVDKEKLPLRTYAGPATYGSVTVQYPKTWSAYITDADNVTPYVDGYFYPNVVPDILSQNSAFALRVQVVQATYSEVLQPYASFIQQKQTQLTPYKAPKVPTVVGARLDGRLTSTKNGSMVVLPLRNMTLKIWTEAPSFLDDFNKNILPNFTFAP